MLSQRTILSVSQLTKDIKLVLETTFGSVWVQGEVSNLRIPTSGHVYFTLKDENSQIRCVLFRQQAMKVVFELKDGLSVLVFARVSVYERDGSYQLYIDTVEPKGKGSLQLAFEQLKARLAKEGLFDEARKKPLPFLPRAIGIITSPTGAVIRDMLHVLDRRFDNYEVILYPVKVQGDEAKFDIVEALGYFNATDCVDVIILARGGGSIEDLWAFNEEMVARAISGSHIPVISAIGHETDFTIADFVSDLRAPTPSRAAELVVPNKEDVHNRIDAAIEDLNRTLGDLIPEYRQRIDDELEHLQSGLTQLVKERRMLFDKAVSRLETLNPLSTLRRGYSITSHAESEALIKDVAHLKRGEHVKTRLAKGSFISIIETIHSEN